MDLLFRECYTSEENRGKTAAKNIRLVTTGINGGRVNGIYAEFELNGDGTQALKRPAGRKPNFCCYLSKRPSADELSLNRALRASCPHKDECKAKICKNVSRVAVSTSAGESAKRQRLMKTEPYKLLARIRNGAETVMPVLRRTCHANAMPVRRLLRGRLFFGFKIESLNCKKLFA